MRRLYLLSSLVLSILCMSCENADQVSVYKEIHIKPVEVSMGMNDSDPHAGLNIMNRINLDDSIPKGPDVPLTWITPEGWKQGQAEGMRTATFIGEADFPVECSIVTLAGQAGGIESNIIRWMRQININPSQVDDFEKFISNLEKVKTSGGIDGFIADLTLLQDGQDRNSPTIIAAILESERGTVFVKMTGSIESAKKNIEQFKALTHSISYK